MKRTWKHWALALALVTVGSLGMVDEANAQTPTEGSVQSRVSQVQKWGFVPSTTPSRASTATLRAAQLGPKQRQFRACVSHRESRDTPTARNTRSSAQGTYQFLDRQWRRGLSFMVADALRSTGEYKPGLRKTLAKTEIANWPARYQDVAFAAVLNARGKWSGAQHWHLSGSKCNQLIER